VKNENDRKSRKQFKNNPEKNTFGRFDEWTSSQTVQLISMGIMIFQQTSGVSAIIFNTVSVFRKAGSNLDSHYATINVGFVQLVFTVASGFFVIITNNYSSLHSFYIAITFKFNLIKLLFSEEGFSGSYPACSLPYLLLHWGSYSLPKIVGEKETTAQLGWLPLLSLIVFFIAYSGGMSNVPFIIMGEMFPNRFRTLLGINFLICSLLTKYL